MSASHGRMLGPAYAKPSQSTIPAGMASAADRTTDSTVSVEGPTRTIRPIATVAGTINAPIATAADVHADPLAISPKATPSSITVTAAATMSTAPSGIPDERTQRRTRCGSMSAAIPATANGTARISRATGRTASTPASRPAPDRLPYFPADLGLITPRRDAVGEMDGGEHDAEQPSEDQRTTGAVE